MTSKEEKSKLLKNAFYINDFLNNGKYDVLVVDDLFDTGASLGAVVDVIRREPKIKKIYVATVTRKR